MAKIARVEIDGRVAKFEVPDDYTPAQAQMAAKQHFARQGAQRLTKNRFTPKAGLGDLATHSMTLGMDNQVAGLASVIGNAVVAPFSKDVDFKPAESYWQGKKDRQDQINDARNRYGALGVATELGTGLASFGAGAAKGITKGVGLLGKVKAGARAGAIGGAVYGNNEGTDLLGSAKGALINGGVGAVLGSAIPLVSAAVKPTFKGISRLVKPNNNLPREMVADAMRGDNLTPQDAGAALDAARKRGSKLSLMDLGPNLRGLGASVSRQPGASKTMVQGMVIPRQAEQSDRIRSALTRDLGPTANHWKLAEDYQAQAQAAAKPFYDEAYAAPFPSNDKIKNLLGRPSTKSAMSRASRIAAEEGRDPMKLGFDVNAAGETVIGREPSFQTLDYVKRGLDDVVEQYRDKVTGKLNLDTEGRAINNTLRSLLGEMDTLNPAYSRARALYAGPVRATSAMRKGMSALSRSADDISAETQKMTPYELDHYRLGLRSGMSNAIDSKGDYADKVNALIGTPQKRKALERVFGGNGGFQNFIDTLGDEGMAAGTYKAVGGGSPTAGRLAEDAITNDQGLVTKAMGDLAVGATQGKAALIGRVMSRLQDAAAFGIGDAGKRARERTAALLSETDPEVLRSIAEEIARDQAAGALSNQRAGNRSAISGATLGSQLPPLRGYVSQSE